MRGQARRGMGQIDLVGRCAGTLPICPVPRRSQASDVEMMTTLCINTDFGIGRDIHIFCFCEPFPPNKILKILKVADDNFPVYED
jgi:hypothetical protein